MTTDSISSRPKDRLDSVQMLRAVAAITVVTHHIVLFGNGEWGVDLFFVISGFIMCYVTADSGRHFFAKRIIRVVPLYWAGTIAVFCVALVVPHLLNNTTSSLVDLFKSLFFIPFKKGDKIFPVLFLGWTLNYEMFFYLLFALSMAASHKSRALVCCGLLLAVVVAGRLIPIESVPFQFLTQPVILEFAFGMLCYTLYVRATGHRTRDRTNGSRILWTSAGALLIACMPFATGILPFEDRVIRWGILAALSFYCIVYGLAGMRLPRSLVAIGDASYSLYLFHPYAIQVFTKILGVFSRRDIRAYLMAVIVIGLCCGLSVLGYKYVEKPISDFLRKKFLERAPRPPEATARLCPASRAVAAEDHPAVSRLPRA